MLIVRGVNLYPSQIEHVLLGIDGVAPHYQLVVERPGASTRSPSAARRARRRRGGLAERVHAALRERTGIGIAVELVAPGDVPRSEGKAVRVIDKR